MPSENPYQLTGDEIQAPPRNFFGMLRYLGPGFILSASIVGSGELIATTNLGAKAGFVAAWVIIFSCLVKVVLQLEFGKQAIYSGETTMEALNKLPGLRIGRAHWSIWAWLALMTLKLFQVAAIVGSVALIANIAMPALPATAWAPIIALVTSLLVFRGYYQLLEKGSLIMMGLFTLLTFASVGVVQFTDYAFSWAEAAGGLIPSNPKGYMIVALGAFGITGVGGDEIMTYNYWLLEKGYAKKVGPRDDSPEWFARARGWIRVMYADALVAMAVYTVMTAAFFILGAAVLHVRNEAPEGMALIETLSRLYTETLGPWAKGLFLFGGFVVLFSTLFSALAGWTRIFTDAFAQVGLLDFHNNRQRRLGIGILAWAFPAIWCALFILVQEPVAMVVIGGGVATTFILLIVIVAALHFRYRRLPAELKPSVGYDIAFWLSAVAISGLVVLSAQKVYEEIDFDSAIGWFRGFFG